MDIHDLKYDYDSSEFKVSEDKFKVYGHENELLHKHILKTNKIFHVLEKSNIIDNYYDFFYNEKIISIDKKKFLELINTFIQYHDMGKLSFNFQINRLNTDNKTKKLNNNGENQLKILKKYEIDSFIEEFDLKHSLVGGLLFITYLFKENIEDNLVFLLFAYAIYGHHSNLKDIIKEENFVWGIKPSSDVTYNTFKIISEYIFKNSEKYNFNKYQKIQKNFADLLNNFDNNILSKLSFFYSYIYSLLISADVIASSYYDLNSNEIPLDQWNNRITPSLLSDMNNTFNNLQINKNNNIQINKNIESITEINSLRKAMLLESSQNLVNNLKSENPSKVFFLNMPTGSGKTNTSIRLALDLLNSEDIDRIFYIVPFINIIEQNYEIIKDSLNLSEENGEIRGLYSALETLLEGSNKEKLKYIMKDDFADIPVVCTTFVSFFNSIIKNKKRNKYKLASLTNSVVIIDEIQSLPLKNWNSLYYLINELAENYNTYFIIMSATLPDFNQLKIDKNTKFNYNICNLIKNPKKYFDHYLFDRTEIKEFKE
ncbi:MAG: CRISPR-associated endonuclease Cas3'', partial [Methanobacteriaceae archaeon]|nr:CRISPR-associated endonuclease Cas3'' [Methanobacteriaceae archaeon]